MEVVCIYLPLSRYCHATRSLTLFLRRRGWRRWRFNGGRGFRRHAFIYACSLRGRWCRFFGHGLLLSHFKEPAGLLRLPPALLQPWRVKLDIGGFRHGQQFNDACFLLRGLLIVFHKGNQELALASSSAGRRACRRRGPCLRPGIEGYCPTGYCGLFRTSW